MRNFTGSTLLLIGALLGTAQAQIFPAKPLRIISGFAPGGATDIAARAVAPRLSEFLGQSVVVENRPGAAGIIAAEMVARSAPDGHMMYLANAMLGAPALFAKLPFDITRDFAFVSLIGMGASVLVLHPSLPAKNLKELIALARARPGDISFSTAGAGSIVHFATEEFASAAQIKVLHVPYKSGVPAMTAAVGGEVQMVIISMPAVWPHVKSGRMRGLAVTTAKRSAFVPDLPALSETIPGYSAVQWWAFLAPAKTPAEIVTKLNAELNRIIGSDEMKPRLAEQGAEPMLMSADQFTKFFREEIAKWRRVVKTLNLQP